MKNASLKFMLLAWVCGLCTIAVAQDANPSLLSAPWKSMWITGPGEPVNIWTGVFPESRKSHVVYKFRKSFALAAAPASFIINVSADNRYKLFVNGKQV